MSALIKFSSLLLCAALAAEANAQSGMLTFPYASSVNQSQEVQFTLPPSTDLRTPFDDEDDDDQSAAIQPLRDEQSKVPIMILAPPLTTSPISGPASALGTPDVFVAPPKPKPQCTSPGAVGGLDAKLIAKLEGMVHGNLKQNTWSKPNPDGMAFTLSRGGTIITINSVTGSLANLIVTTAPSQKKAANSPGVVEQVTVPMLNMATSLGWVNFNLARLCLQPDNKSIKVALVGIPGQKTDGGNLSLTLVPTATGMTVTANIGKQSVNIGAFTPATK